MVSEEVWSYSPIKDEQFVFLHIPKTGGTTFRNILSNHFDESLQYPTKQDLVKNNGRYLSAKNLIESKSVFYDKSLVIGHYGIGIKQQLKKGVKTIAFFRNPLSRIYSHIKHIREHDPKLKGQDPNLIIEKKFDVIVGLQARMMGFNSKKRNIEEVVENIRSLDVIGIQERFSDSIALCNRTFGWKLKEIEKMNVAKSNEPVALHQDWMSEICRQLQPELKTYNVAYKIFEKRSTAKR